MTQTEKTGHLAWCALVALCLAREDGQVSSASQENLFLTRWLAAAQKQRRFSRDVAADIEWLLNQGRQLGIRAKLPSKLDYLWRSCSGEMSAQTDLFRLTYGLETAKALGWRYGVLSDREWSGRNAVKMSDAENVIYLSQTNLDEAFDEDGGQVSPVMARVSGHTAGLVGLLASCGWGCEANADAPPWEYRLGSEQGKGRVSVAD